MQEHDLLDNTRWRAYSCDMHENERETRNLKTYV